VSVYPRITAKQYVADRARHDRLPAGPRKAELLNLKLQGPYLCVGVLQGGATPSVQNAASGEDVTVGIDGDSYQPQPWPG